MRKSIHFFLPVLIALFFVGCGGADQYPRSTPEELGESIFNIIKAKDKEGLKSLMLDKADFTHTIENMPYPPEIKDKALAGMEENWKSLQKEIENNVLGEFESIHATMDKKYDLSTAEFKGIRLENLLESPTLTSADIMVLFTSSGGDGEIHLTESAEFPSGWTISPEGFSIK